MFPFTSRVTVPPHVLIRKLERESVLLNLETQRYFGLDETGTRIWQLLTASDSIGAAYRELLVEYDVDPDRLRDNLADLLDRLVAHGLLRVLSQDAQTRAAG